MTPTFNYINPLYEDYISESTAEPWKKRLCLYCMTVFGQRRPLEQHGNLSICPGERTIIGKKLFACSFCGHIEYMSTDFIPTERITKTYENRSV